MTRILRQVSETNITQSFSRLKEQTQFERPNKACRKFNLNTRIACVFNNKQATFAFFENWKGNRQIMHNWALFKIYEGGNFSSLYINITQSLY
jgi:hypothetical protein